MKKLLFTFLITTHLIAFAQKETKEKIIPIPKPQSFVTSHQGTFNGKTIKYKATAKESYLKNSKGDSVASIWSVAYTQDGITNSSKRPVTFVFNGGPGSASIWLHMGLFGPKIVKVDSDAKKDDGAAPYDLRTNEHGLLDLTDFVFVDPVGTGYSRVIGKGSGGSFAGPEEL